jgi:transposase-like protein
MTRAEIEADKAKKRDAAITTAGTRTKPIQSAHTAHRRTDHDTDRTTDRYSDHYTDRRKVLCSTNAIESLNARYRRAVRRVDTFPPSRPR